MNSYDSSRFDYKSRLLKVRFRSDYDPLFVHFIGLILKHIKLICQYSDSEYEM